MKSFSIKTTVAAAATAATLLTSGIAPTVTAANAEAILVPGLTGKINPLTPNPCMANPALCGPGGLTVEPPAPPPPPPPAPSGPSAGAQAAGVAALLLGGAIAGAALANSRQPKTVHVEPVGNPSAHSAWCHGKYKSYRDEDNSWLSYSGVRKPCISPYL
jgi:hypothetical protein